MKIDFAVRVDIGSMETNDDRALVSGHIFDMQSQSGTIDTPAVVAVCDGCGGYAYGGVAAQAVLEFLSHETPCSLSDINYLNRTLENCQQMIMEMKDKNPQYSAMCTTIAGCVLCDDSIMIFHSGDSRVYRHDRWCLAKMTRDHSVVQDMIDTGEITAEEALEHPKRNVISRCIGINGLPAEIYVTSAPINPGEKYILCSDGLWESVKDAQIKEILDSNLTLQQMVDTLVEKALEQGADDNITVCVCSRQGMIDEIEKKPFVLD